MSYNAPPPPPDQGGGYGDQPPGGGYGQPGGYGGPPAGPPQDHPKAQTAMILGIVSLVCCSPLGIAAYIVGNNALKEIEASGGQLGGAGMAKAGKICGIIAMVLLVLGIVFYGLLFATGAMTEVSTM